mmetsp:Transcript_6414/g.18794  ORF Transcript_6414/g.18794 Transcript_6414/m.18794 type:complete len:258 (+) Transcript_6414:697-1470(+)
MSLRRRCRGERDPRLDESRAVLPLPAPPKRPKKLLRRDWMSADPASGASSPRRRSSTPALLKKVWLSAAEVLIRAAGRLWSMSLTRLRSTSSLGSGNMESREMRRSTRAWSPSGTADMRTAPSSLKCALVSWGAPRTMAEWRGPVTRSIMARWAGSPCCGVGKSCLPVSISISTQPRPQMSTALVHGFPSTTSGARYCRVLTTWGSCVEWRAQNSTVPKSISRTLLLAGVPGRFTSPDTRQMFSGLRSVCTSSRRWM